jgi:hypothetical protein
MVSWLSLLDADRRQLDQGVLAVYLYFLKKAAINK